MSELQLALIGAAVIAVAAVWGYNLRQERKYRKVANELFRGGQDDVLVSAGTRSVPVSPAIAPVVAGERLEPGFGNGDHEPASDADSESFSSMDAPVRSLEGRRPDDVAGDVDTLPVGEVVPPIPVDQLNAQQKSASAGESYVAVAVDQMCECFAQIDVTQPLSAAGVWAVQSSWSGLVSKPVTWLARNDVNEPWIRVDAASNARYGHWMVAVQLVDRRGAITDGDLTRFYDGVSEFGRQVGAAADLPPRPEMLQRAQQLDQFCAQVDVQFSLSIIHAQGGSFPGTKLRGMCEAAGLELGADGRYHARSAAGETEFTLANLGTEGFEAQSLSSLATNGVVLTIDVPCVSDGVAAFNRMSVTARQMANGLGGVLVDAQRAPLSDAMIVAIRAKIDEIQQAMRAAEIQAGGARAHRLFS